MLARPEIPANTNFLTLDIEEWYHADYPGLDLTQHRNRPTNLEALVDRLIALCARSKTLTTCFILGDVARRYPSVVRRLHEAGHEVASHGSHHLPVHAMTPAQFEADLADSCDVLESLTGRKVLGFRAPSFSVRQEMLSWYYGALEARGLKYSSSVFPGKTFLYGIPDAPQEPHYAAQGSLFVEFPMPVIRLPGLHLGLYPRLFPASIMRRKILSENRRNRPVVLYLHPREIDPHQLRLPLSPMLKLIHYWGIRSCEREVGALLASLPGRFRRLADVLPG
jgi:polysaccharide deacetylase family protein (PEP-CTERM system associated)